jgi:flagellar protein FliS
MESVIMKGVEIYQDAAVTTQSSGRIVVMLYDGAIKFLKLAIKEIESNNPEAKGVYITKALDILYELNTVLDIKAGGEIAQNLRSMYLFMIRHLSNASLKQDVNMVKEVIGLLEELNEGWRAITL